MAVLQAVATVVPHRCVRCKVGNSCRSYLRSRTTPGFQQQSSNFSVCSKAFQRVPSPNVANVQQRCAVKRCNFRSKRRSPTAKAASPSNSASAYKEESRPSNIYVAVSFWDNLSSPVCTTYHNLLRSCCLLAAEYIGRRHLCFGQQSAVQDGSCATWKLCILPGSAANLWLCSCILCGSVLAL